MARRRCVTGRVHPSARPEGVEEARERLSNLLGWIKIVPESGRLVAQVGLQALEFRPYIGLVAGA